MTDGHRSVMSPRPPPPSRTIDTSPPPSAPRKGRVHARRRLALLSTGLLAATAVTALAGASSDGAPPGGADIVAMAGADQQPLEGGPDDATFSPVSVAERTMADLGEATTSTVGAAPRSTSSSSSSSSSTSEATTTTAGDAPTTTAPPATTAPPTTAPPTTAPPTTRAASPPPPAPEPAGSGYAYDDPRSTQVWYDLAGCEAGGNWAADTGNGYYGGLQFSLGSWQNVGGRGYPHENSAQTQIEMGRRLQAAQGWDAWPSCARKLGLR